MRRFVISLLYLLYIAWSGAAAAHALAERSIPASGATLAWPPHAVTVYFDAELEPVFSKLVVRNAQGARVSTGYGEIFPTIPRH